MLTCYFRRRQLGAYLDAALPARTARAVGAHLETCTACQREVQGLRRLSALLRRTVITAEPDWTGFWPGVVRGIEAAKHATPASAAPVRVAWRPRVALAGALTAGLLALTLWQAMEGPPTIDSGVIVQTAQTEAPGGSVMVYTPPEEDMTVIWVFGLDKSGV